MTLQFEMPTSLTAEKFIEKLGHLVNRRLISREQVQITYYDSFDWRLYQNGISGEFIQAKPESTFLLKSLENGAIIAGTELSTAPVFSKDFKPGIIRNTLQTILEMRALMPICTVKVHRYQLNILNNDEKTVLRMAIEEYEHFTNRVCLQPVKGYEKAVARSIEILSTELGLINSEEPVLLTALKRQDHQPKNYSSKLAIELDPDTRADIATKSIFRRLLNIIKINEQGTIADIDSEFLHDFRVAVRRTRTGLSQLKGVLPENSYARFAEFFAWLGQITGPTRDFDVYLLNFEHYKSSLPILIREDINPLYDFLLAKKTKAHKEMATKLRSPKYRSTMAEWEAYLNDSSPTEAAPLNANRAIKELANIKIWKNFKRVLHKGRSINSLTSAEALHDLRKACKKLRYLIEFFQSLYPEHTITVLIKKLKDLQEVLGDYQDFDVQESNLKQFSNDMLSKNTPVNTYLAMGVLIQKLDTRKADARKQFESRFEAYIQTEKSLHLKTLFANQLAEKLL